MAEGSQKAISQGVGGGGDRCRGQKEFSLDNYSNYLNHSCAVLCNFHNNPSNIDLSYKMTLEFLVVLEDKKISFHCKTSPKM